MLSLLGKDLVAQFYSFYYGWGFYYSAGLLYCIKKHGSLVLMG